jgi:hypothetical protein
MTHALVSTAPTLSLVPEKDDVDTTDPRPIKQKSQNYIIDTILEKIKNFANLIDKSIAPLNINTNVPFFRINN